MSVEDVLSSGRDGQQHQEPRSETLQIKDEKKGQLETVESGRPLPDLSPESEKAHNYLKGWRLHLMTLGGAMCVLLVNMEVSIIGTSLVAITDDLHSFDRASWVVTGYLITYCGMLIIWAKLSEIFGRKWVLITSTVFFTVFSGACGAAQTMNQLIAFRVFQGVGAAGSLAIALAICYEIVPPEKYQLQAVQYTSAIALGSLIGPLIGGAFSERSTWRWVFLVNVPAGAVVVMLLIFAIPAHFPFHGDPDYKPPTLTELWSRATLGRLDVFGASLLLSATMLLVAVLLEAGNSFTWNSATSIALLVASGVLWIIFLINERAVTKDNWRVEPVFPWRFFFNRNWIGVLMMCLASGVPYNTLVINIPQRFQAVDNISPFGAGVRLIPFNFSISLGSVLANLLAERLGILPIVNMLFGSVLQLVGLVLFSRLPDNGEVPNAIYGYMVLVGLGAGVIIGICLVLPPQTVESRDLPVASGALFQFRTFGGVLGLAIATTAINNYTTAYLPAVITPQQQHALQRSISEIHSFPPDVQKQIQAVFAQGYNVQMKIMVGFAAAQVLAVLLLWRKPQIRLVTRKSKQKESEAKETP